VTDKEEFFRTCIVDVESAGSMPAHGRAELSVPTDSMHSFEAPHNRVLWRLLVKGRIPRWPDVSEEYPILVLPHEPEPAGPRESDPTEGEA
jgi:hypothetical protein